MSFKQATRLNKEVDQISKQLHYLLEYEDEFNSKTIVSYTKILVLTSISIAIFMISCYIQGKYLRSYFIQKKRM